MSDPLNSEGLAALRGRLWVAMLGQPSTEARDTYSDGFKNGLIYSIEHIDKLLATTHTVSSETFDALEALGGKFPELKGYFARGTGSADLEYVVQFLAPLVLAATPASTGEPVAWTGDAIPISCPFPSAGTLGAPDAYEIDPGIGSAMNRVQREWPAPSVIENMQLRGGSVRPLYIAPPEVSALQAQIKALTEEREPETKLLEAHCRALMTKIYNRGHSGLDDDCALCQAFIAADRLLSFETGAPLSVEVCSWDRRAEARATEGERQLAEALLDQVKQVVGYHIVSPPTADDTFVNVCNGDLRKLQDALVAFVLASPSPAREEGWQPIETAPKDGTHFLGWRDWDGNPKSDLDFSVAEMWWRTDILDWTGHMDWQGHRLNVTHWRPLPTSPTPSKRSGE